MKLPELVWFGDVLCTFDGRRLTEAQKQAVKEKCKDKQEFTHCTDCGHKMPPSLEPIKCEECGSPNTVSPYYC